VDDVGCSGGSRWKVAWYRRGKFDFLAVHSLDAGHREVARLFGTKTGDEVDKFAECRWHPGVEGVPILDDVPKFFVGQVLDRVPLGDHTGFLLAPVAFGGPDRQPTLTLSSVGHWIPGHPGGTDEQPDPEGAPGHPNPLTGSVR
jgi:hypothetical protein